MNLKSTPYLDGQSIEFNTKYWPIFSFKYVAFQIAFELPHLDLHALK